MKKLSLRSAVRRMRSSVRARFIEQLECRRVMAVDWRNPVDSLDVSQDQAVTPIDALLVINEINSGGSRRLADVRPATARFIDSSGDQFLSAIDALLVINHLNSNPNGSRSLSEGSGIASESSVTVTLGQSSGARKLRYQIESSFDTTDQLSIPKDQLAVYLVDPSNTSSTLLDRGTAGTPLFTLVESRVEFAAGIVAWDGSILEIDATGLANRDTGIVKFQLLSGDSDSGSKFVVRPLTNNVDLQGSAGDRVALSGTNTTGGPALDVALLTPSSGVKVTASDVRYVSETGLYSAVLQLRNDGAAVGKQVALAFPGLPNGIVLKGASGTTASGTPYLNVSGAVAQGGLPSGERSNGILVEFENPDRLLFSLKPQVLVKSNQAPVLPAITTQVLTPGAYLQLNLQATDADGDVITYHLENGTGFPSGQLSASGRLTLRPTPADLGSFSFDVVASDGSLSARQRVTIQVVEDSKKTTRVSGVVQLTDGTALVNVPVQIGAVQGFTQADGSFQLDLGSGTVVGDTLKVRGELVSGKNLPFIAERLPLVLEHDVYVGYNNVIARPVFLPEIDIANGQTIDPQKDNTVTSAAIEGAKVEVAAGTLMNQQGAPYTGLLTLTPVPTQLTPAALPVNVSPDMVVTIQPGEMVFARPAPLTLPNVSGQPAGTIMDLWAINPSSGAFEVVGTGQVSADGKVIDTIAGGVRYSSWQFFAPPPPTPKPAPTPKPKPPNDSCGGGFGGSSGSSGSSGDGFEPFASVVNLQTGAVVESHELAACQSLGVARGVELVYNSLQADPKPIVTFGYDNAVVGEMMAVLEINIGGGVWYKVPGYVPRSSNNGSFSVIDTLPEGAHFWSTVSGSFDAAIQADLAFLPSGKYAYRLTTGLGNIGERQVFSGGSTGGSGGGGASESTITTFREFTGSSAVINGELIHVNRQASALGSGWGIAGLQELVENRDGSILLIQHGGGELEFKKTNDSNYQSPAWDFSKLEKLPDGTFQRTLPDQTTYQFNSSKQLETIRDRNRNETRYVYGTQGRLDAIVDAVGRRTTFNYTGGRVTSIVDSANRTTLLTHDANGNMTTVTDPDGASRTWGYDSGHRMTSEVDQRGLREEVTYDFAGRAQSALRKDGTVVSVRPADVQLLVPASLTTKPLDPPPVFLSQDRPAVFVDGNGRVIRTALDALGRPISAQDGESQLPIVKRNDRFQVIESSDARGNTTLFTYDDQGNLLSQRDNFSNGGAITGTIAAPGDQAEFTFEGQVGQRVIYDALESDFDGIAIRIYSPSGDLLVNGNADSDVGPFTLAENGTYRMVVDGLESTTGDYRFRLLDVANATALTLGVPVSTALETGSANKLYRFSGSRDQRFYLQTLSGNDDATWIVNDSADQHVDSSGFFRDGEFTLPADGEYLLVVRSESPDPVTVRFQLLTPLTTQANIAIGSEVSGSIANVGDQAEFSFTATTGQRILFDSLGGASSGTLRVQIADASGRTVDFDTSMFADHVPVTLLASGTYKVTVDGVRESTGTFRFRLLDMAQASALSFATETSGTLNSGMSAKALRFSGAAGDRIYLQRLDGGNNAQWIVYAPDNQVVSARQLTQDLEFILPVTGSYLLVLGGADDTADVDYRFQAYRAATETRDITIGSLVTGTIAAPGNESVLRFQASSGQRLVFDALNADSPSIFMSVTAPSGELVFSGFVFNDFKLVYLKESGTFTIQLDGSEATIGDYRFQILDAALAQAFTLGADITSTLSDGLASRIYRFAGASAQHVYFYDLQSSTSATWSVADSNGRIIAPIQQLSDLELILPYDDQYYLIARGYDAVAPVDLHFRSRVPLLSQSSVALGQQFQGSIAARGDEARFNFAATQGQHLILDGRSTDFKDVRMTLVSPSLNVLISGYAYDDLRVFPLIESGEYQLFVDGTGATTGDFQIAITDADQASAVTLDAPFAGSITTGGAMEVHRFTVNAARRVRVETLAASGNYATWELVNEAGLAISRGDLGSGPIDATLPSAGQYYLLVHGASPTEGQLNYTLLVSDVTVTVGAVTGLETEFTGVLQPAEEFEWEITASAGQAIYIDLLDITFNSILLSLIAPDSNAILSRVNLFSDLGPYVLPKTGTYTLKLENWRDDIDANYRIRVLDLNAATPIAIGQVVESSFVSGTEARVYAFPATAGQRFIYDALERDFDDISAQLYVPSLAQSLTGSSNADSDSSLLVLPESGKYYMILSANTGTETDATFQLRDVSSPAQINFDSEVSGTLVPGMANKFYKLSGSAGQHAYFHALVTDFDGRWTLFGPGGDSLVSARLFQDFEFTFNSSGEYWLGVSGAETQQVDYRFEVRDAHTTTQALVPGVAVTGSIQSPGDRAVFTFAGQAGQRYYFDSLDLDEDALLVDLFAPGDEQLWGGRSNVNIDQGSFTLVRSGTFQLVVFGSGAAVGDFTFRLLDLSTANNLVPGTNIAGSLVPGSSARAFKFNAQSGDRMYFENVSVVGEGTWAITGPSDQFISSRSLNAPMEVELPISGEYNLILSGNSVDDVEYRFHALKNEITHQGIAIGSNVSAQIAQPGDQAEFTFDGTVGQHLVFDNQSLDFIDARIHLFTPISREPLYTIRGGDAFDWILPASGQYRLVIDGVGEMIGPLAFRLIDVGAVAEVARDTIVTGTLTPGKATELYRITGQAGERFYIESLTESEVASWFIYSQSSDVIASNQQTEDLEFVLPANGAYLLAVAGSTDGTNSPFSFRVRRAEQLSSTIAVGNVISGNLAGLGDQVIYQVTLQAGQHLFYDALDNDLEALNVQLLSPDGDVLIGGLVDSDFGPFPVLRTGVYTLVVDGRFAAVGDYSFQIVDADQASLLPLNTDVTGALGGSLATRIYRVQANPDQPLYFDSLSGGVNGTWNLVDARGVSLGVERLDVDFVASTRTTEDAYLLVRSETVEAIPYRFHVRLPQVRTLPLTLGAETSGSITNVGDAVEYTFTGTVGGRLVYDGTDDDNDQINMSLFAPSGQRLRLNDANQDDSEVLMSEPGTYRLRLESADGTTGDFRFRLNQIEAALGLNLGTSFTATLPSGNANLIRRFTGSAGQRIRVESLSSSSADGSWALIDTWGEIITGSTINSGPVDAVLRADGVYAIQFSGTGARDAKLSFTFLLSDVTGASTAPSGLGTIRQGSLAGGASNTVTFTAPAGRYVVFDSLLNTNSPIVVSLTDPLSNALFSQQNSGIDSAVQFLPRSGTYTLRLSNTDSQTADYAFRMLDLAAATPLVLGATVQGNLPTGNETEIYSFTGTAGQRLVFDGLDSDDDRILYQLITPSGQGNFYWPAANQYDDSLLTLVEGGVYRLLVIGSQSQAANYAFRLLNAATSERIEGSAQTSGAFDSALASKIVRFSAQTNEQIYLQSLQSDGQYSWTVYSPSGQYVIVRNGVGDIEFVATEGGDYTLLLRSTSDGNLNYRFQLNRAQTLAQSLKMAASNFGTVFTYDSKFNQITSSIDELGRKTVYELDPATGNVLVETFIVGQLDSTENSETDDLVTRYTYGAFGLIDTVTDPLGRITDYDYDSRGQSTATTFAKGTSEAVTIRREYDAAGNLTALIDEKGARTQYQYDSMNRMTRVTSPDPDGAGPLTSSENQFEYDAGGNLTKLTDALGHTTTFVIDAVGRRSSTIEPSGARTEYRYDQAGNLTRVIDALGNETVNRYDSRNRLVSQTDAAGGVTNYRYDRDNNLLSLVDPQGNETRYRYDARNRLVQETDPLGAVTTYTYDAADNLVGKIDRNGRTTQYELDALDRVTREYWVGTDKTVTYQYDKVGNLLLVSDSDSQLALSYDQRDQIRTVSNAGTAGVPQVVLQLSYDAAGNRVAVADSIGGVATGATSYAYDSMDRVTGLQQSGASVQSKRVDFSYNANSQVASMSRYSDLVASQLVNGTAYTYDINSRLATLRHTKAGADLARYAFSYDTISRITAITDIDGLTTYGYDKTNQVTSANHADPANPDEAFSYDKNGNRLTSSSHGSGYQTTAANRLVSDGSFDYTYDAEGNLVRRVSRASGEIRTFEWDFRNQLTSVSDATSAGVPIQRIDYQYDALNRRIGQQVDKTPSDGIDGVLTSYVYDGEDVILDFVDPDGRGPAVSQLDKRYLHGPAVDQILAQESEGGRVDWLLADHLGTIRDVTNAQGVVVNHIKYDSFGNQVSQTSQTVTTRYGFTGREFDAATNLMHYRARYYDSAIGQFISEDPLGFVGRDTNLRRYVHNSPIMFFDPSGTCDSQPGRTYPSLFPEGYPWEGPDTNPSPDDWSDNSESRKPPAPPPAPPSLGDLINDAVDKATRIDEGFEVSKWPFAKNPGTGEWGIQIKINYGF